MLLSNSDPRAKSSPCKYANFTCFPYNSVPKGRCPHVRPLGRLLVPRQLFLAFPLEWNSMLQAHVQPASLPLQSLSDCVDDRDRRPARESDPCRHPRQPAPVFPRLFFARSQRTKNERRGKQGHGATDTAATAAGLKVNSPPYFSRL